MPDTAFPGLVTGALLMLTLLVLMGSERARRRSRADARRLEGLLQAEAARGEAARLDAARRLREAEAYLTELRRSFSPSIAEVSMASSDKTRSSAAVFSWSLIDRPIASSVPIIFEASPRSLRSRSA